MMSEIYRRGPVVCSVATPEAFDYGYRAGIYDDPQNYTRDSIDHNVEVCVKGGVFKGFPGIFWRFFGWASLEGEKGLCCHGMARSMLLQLLLATRSSSSRSCCEAHAAACQPHLLCIIPCLPAPQFGVSLRPGACCGRAGRWLGRGGRAALLAHPQLLGHLLGRAGLLPAGARNQQPVPGGWRLLVRELPIQAVLSLITFATQPVLSTLGRTGHKAKAMQCGHFEREAAL